MFLLPGSVQVVPFNFTVNGVSISPTSVDSAVVRAGDGTEIPSAFNNYEAGKINVTFTVPDLPDGTDINADVTITYLGQSLTDSKDVGTIAVWSLDGSSELEQVCDAIESLQSILDSGATTITQDGQTIAFDHDSARRRLRSLRDRKAVLESKAEGKKKRKRRTLVNRINLS